MLNVSVGLLGKSLVLESTVVIECGRLVSKTDVGVIDGKEVKLVERPLWSAIELVEPSAAVTEARSGDDEDELPEATDDRPGVVTYWLFVVVWFNGNMP